MMVQVKRSGFPQRKTAVLIDLVDGQGLVATLKLAQPRLASSESSRIPRQTSRVTSLMFFLINLCSAGN